MTRTYVVGEPPEEIVEYHRLVKAALDRALETTRAGIPATEPFRAVCDLFQEAGYPTQLSKGPGEVLTSGFFHGLGHGVGLEVHEPPWLGRAPGDMVAGDVVTLEPGLYRQGFGGVRLEDLVLVTESGAENLTDIPYELAPVTRDERRDDRDPARGGAAVPAVRPSSQRRRTRSPTSTTSRSRSCGSARAASA